jgi:hypothetical protein
LAILISEDHTRFAVAITIGDSGGCVFFPDPEGTVANLQGILEAVLILWIEVGGIGEFEFGVPETPIFIVLLDEKPRGFFECGGQFHVGPEILLDHPEGFM